MSWLGIAIAVVQTIPTEYVAGAIVVGSNIRTTVETIKWAHSTAKWMFTPTAPDTVDTAWQWVDTEEILIEKKA